MLPVHCPDCDGGIHLGPNVEIGLRLVCPHCDAELRVSRIDPPAVDWVYDWSWVQEEEKESW